MIAEPSIERIPLTVTVVLLAIVFVPEVPRVRLLKVVVVPIPWFPDPPKTTVPVPGLKREPVPLHADDDTEFTFSTAVLSASAPAVSAMFPLNVCVSPAPRLRVPPAPLIVSVAPVTPPVNIALPPVFVIETAPVVVKLPRFWIAVVPARVTVELPTFHGVAFPLLKSPWKVRPKPAV